MCVCACVYELPVQQSDHVPALLSFREAAGFVSNVLHEVAAVRMKIYTVPAWVLHGDV